MRKYELLELVEMGRIELENVVKSYGFRADDKTRGDMIDLILELQGTPLKTSEKG